MSHIDVGHSLTLLGEEQLALDTAPLFERLRSRIHVDLNTGCWLICSRNDDYASLRRNGREEKAHRVAYELLVGPIPEGFTIDHLCRRKNCVNPNHLEAVTNRENVLRGVGATAHNAAKTECIRGHPFDETNTYFHPRRLERRCRICQRADHNRAYARKRAGEGYEVRPGQRRD